MKPIKIKLMRKFKLSAEDVQTLMDAGLNTPVKIRQAATKDLPDGFAQKLGRGD